MTAFTVVNHDWEQTVNGLDTRAQADDKRKSALSSFDIDPDDIEIVAGDYEDYAEYESADTTDEVDPDVVDHSPDSDDEPVPVPNESPEDVIDEREDTPVEPAQETGDALDELGESLGTDPLSILPGHMIDQIQGQPAINKRGYAMIAERYGVEVQSHIEEYPWDNDEGRCVARATAETEDGKEYQDYATASEADGDMSEQLIELASTRALKRVTGWATGLGIVSYQELASELES